MNSEQIIDFKLEYDEQIDLVALFEENHIYSKISVPYGLESRINLDIVDEYFWLNDSNSTILKLGDIPLDKIYHVQFCCEVDKVIEVIGWIRNNTYCTERNPLPQVWWVMDLDIYLLGNGNHRVSAHRLMEETEIRCEVFVDDTLDKLINFLWNE